MNHPEGVAARNDTQAELEALQYENEKLKKINQVLIDRIEKGGANQGEAYRSFQNAALLADKVKDRTIKLRRTLYKLEEANQNLSQTRQESAHSRQRLLDTIESISDAIVLFDKNRRLVLANSQFMAFWKDTDAKIEAGHTRYRDIIPLAVRHGIYDPQNKTYEKLVHRGEGYRDTVILMADGRWLQMSERPTADNGLVVVYSDITQLKQSEMMRQERALAEKNRILQSMIDNLPLGVALVSEGRSIEAWNVRFLELLGVASQEVAVNQAFVDILGKSLLAELSFPPRELPDYGHNSHFESEQLLPNGKVLALKTHRIPGGGYVNTFQDVTEQRRTAEALRNAYKHMEQRVNERTRELSALNQKLRVEIEEREQIEQSLIEAKGEAEHANVSKTKFMAAASHDLLQPLNAARLFATALLDNALPEHLTNLIQSLSYSLADVESLLGTLVDISKLEAGVVEPIVDSFVVNELLSNLAREFAPQAEEAGIRFDYLPCDSVVQSDSQLLARILRNFLSNAIRYTDSGRIVMGCRRRGDNLEIQVWDTGAGIREDQLKEIFLEFKRVGSKSKREDKGLGLGLAIVDKLSRVLSHQVKVRSEYGRGSMFSVLVPTGFMVSQTDDAEQERSGFIDPLPGKKILVVDNDDAICKGMQVVLGGWGCEVVSAQGLDELRDSPSLLTPPPDLLILDYHLDEGVTGLDAHKLISQLCSSPMPCLMITADYSNALRQQAKDLGFRLLNKPIKPLKLRSMLVYLLSAVMAP